MDCVHIQSSSACLCKLCIINIENIIVFNILRHFKCFYNVLLPCLMIEILPRVLNMDCKWTKLAFCLLRGDLNICGCETDGKLRGLSCNSVDVLPSRSSSRSRDWKLWIETRQFCKNSPISQKSIYAHMRWVFRQFEKEIYIAKLQLFFFAFIGHLAYVRVTWSFFNLL